MVRSGPLSGGKGLSHDLTDSFSFSPFDGVGLLVLSFNHHGTYLDSASKLGPRDLFESSRLCAKEYSCRNWASVTTGSGKGFESQLDW